LRIVHQHKMLHLDIKPANIFITDDNKAVMIDFGAAREVLSKEGNFIRPMYTPGFAAPEMYRRDRPWAPGPTSTPSAPASMPACRATRPTTRRSGWKKTALRWPVPPARCLFRQPDRSGRVVHVAGPAVAPAVGVCAAKGAQPRTERRYTKLSVGEKMRLQFDNMVTDGKKSLKRHWLSAKPNAPAK
jgi:serine/threonine protein kinase